MRYLPGPIALVLLFGAVLALSAQATSDPPRNADQELFTGLEWREIGPYRGGRSAAVTGLPDDPDTYYFGATGGGVWKTTDAGKSWKSVSDGFFGGSVGAVAVSEWDPNVLYVGMGEKTVRGNVSHGDGMWKSTDAGKSWTHVGLADSRHIPRVRIHPRNPDLVYAAVLGHLYGPNEERGIFRSKDGGKTWEKVHFVSNEVGAVDLVMDPTNPRILYASFWRVIRKPWTLESGGEGSGIWKTTDGGDTWTELTGNPGLPKPPIGISGITVSKTNPENLYAILEAEEGGVFRSKDGGKTWARTSDDRNLRQRAWYYSRIYADPANEESVYVLNVRFHHSIDGGRTFSQISTPHGDNHDLWIAPNDPKRMIQSNDGGANVSKDGGETWSPQSNQPTAQMYRVSTDNDYPYRLLGGQQDNSAVRIRSRSAFGASIGTRDWEPTAGGESGHIAAKPDDPDIVYGGSYGGFLVRVDHRTGERRAVNVWPDNPMGRGTAELKYRFQWNFPLFFSPHDPDVLYAAANVLFKTENGGQSWEALSPDLTKNDKATQGPSGGPITKDNTGVEYYATIFAALESPHEAGVFWAASDDGLIHVSRNGGETWEDVTPPDLPEWMMWNSIEAHPSEPGGLYAAGTRYKLDDFAPYLYKTTDWGQTWTRINDGIPADHFTRVIRADPDRAGLLYAGTERGLYLSLDDGTSWQSLQLDLPITPITDLAVKENDLIAATQGRGYWILDDLSTLHQWHTELIDAPAHLFTPRPSHRLTAGGFRRPADDAGKNPPAGVVLTYHLGEEAAENSETEIVLEIFEDDGDLVRRYTRKPAEGEKSDGEEAGGGRGPGEEDLRQLPSEAGLNRFAWNLSYPPAEGFPGMILWAGGLDGPSAVPGTYKAKLTVGEWSGETDFEVLADPRVGTPQEDFRRQFDFQIAVRDDLSRTHREIRRIRNVRQQIEGLSKRLEASDLSDEEREAIDEASTALLDTMKEIEEALYQTKNKSRQDPLNFPIKLNDKLAGVGNLAALGDFRPTDQMLAVRDELTAQIDAELAKLQAVWDEDLPALEAMLAKKSVPLLALPPLKDDEEEDSGL